MRHILGFSLLALASAGVTAQGDLIDFSDQSLPNDSFNNGGPDTNSTGFHSGGAFLDNNFTNDPKYGSYYNGWALSNVNDTGADYPTVPDFGGTHPYAAIAGSGADGLHDVYAVGYSDGFDPLYINLPAGQRPASVKLTNSTTDFLSIENGDFVGKKFDSTDFFDVTLTGFSGPGDTGVVTGSTHFYLAQNGTIVTDWTSVDLAALGDASSIDFSFTSSDNGAFGINTPTYVALDDLTTVPEPSSLGWLALASVWVLSRYRKTEPAGEFSSFC